MGMPYVKIKVGGKVVGNMYLLGIDSSKSLRFFFYSTKDNTSGGALASVCQGVFDAYEQIISADDSTGFSFIGKVMPGKCNPRDFPLAHQVEYMKKLAACLQKK